jgi:Protein of unknown function (DUF3606)
MATAKKAGIVDKVRRAITGIFSSDAKKKTAPPPTTTAKKAATKTARRAAAVAKKGKKSAAPSKRAATKSAPAKKSASMDRKLIALSQPHELRDWCKSLNCTEDQLRAAVAAVGNSAASVRAHLGERQVAAS